MTFDKCDYSEPIDLSQGPEAYNEISMKCLFSGCSGLDQAAWLWRGSSNSNRVPESILLTTVMRLS